MKIRQIAVGEVQVPLTVPFKTALRTVDHVHSLIVRIETDNGMTGYGEAAATAVITGDLIGSMRAGMAVLAPRLIGCNLATFNANLSLVANGLVHRPLRFARASLRGAALSVTGWHGWIGHTGRRGASFRRHNQAQN
jgi:L-alanine-DL-glutamate epimerase-like enolase superfamily enzyme